MPARSIRRWWPLPAASHLSRAARSSARSAAAAPPEIRTRSPARRARTPSSNLLRRDRTDRGLGAAVRYFSVAGVSDQRFLLPPQQDQDGADDGEHERDRLVEKVGLDHALPGPRPAITLDH